MAQDEELYDGEDLAGGYEEEIPMEGTEDVAAQTAEELEAMKKKLKEMEEEAARLRAMQAGAGAPDGAAAGPSAANAAAEASAKEEVDSRSIYVGNVDYSCTPEELQQHFQSCGTVNRVTILTDKFGNPKGYAYIEFLEVDAVTNAVLLDNTELRGRQIKVSPKRTNVPGLKARGRGRGPASFRGGFTPYGRGGYYPPQPYYGGRGRGFNPTMAGGYGFAPRGRGRGGRFYSPY